ncbi:MAG TPA: chromosome segregation protein SMC [Candidatus Thermoplasmatota archaeon]|nr:chromosome segregation protein SMC [Candidatus Thermoplasmatota archaeon]
MHLKSIELENFKSFGRHVVIPFLPGFTAITGPNGSGKSNISDAILFVLGPNSPRAIRAGKLTDLIFNGGKTKQGAKFCKVSLTFDNTDRTIPIDGDEVTLTRLVKYSKTSKDNYYSYFYVNGRASNLTEFENLLAHARISADGYNIVKQGDVTRIVEMSPLERRRLLDDIAGITKFDDDIVRAEKKRVEVEQNLERIGIILREIDQQLRLLEKDREGAEKYRNLKTEQDLVRAKLAVKRAEAARRGILAAREAIARHEQDKRDLEGKLAQLREELGTVEARLAEIDQRFAATGGEEARELRGKVEAMRVEIAKAEELANHCKLEIQERKAEAASTKAALATTEKERKRLDKERAEAEAKLAKARRAAEEKSAALEGVRGLVSRSNSTASDLQRELARMKVDYERLQADVHESELARDRLAAAVERASTELGHAQELVKTCEFEIKDVDWNLKELRKEDKGASDKLESLRREHFAQKKEEGEISRQMAELEPVVRKLRTEYSQLKAEADAAESFQKGYTRAVEAILAARDEGRLKGICGTIAELGKVDKKYETALETAAGGRLMSIVTETDADAAAAIELLKKHRLGRATFLPLSKMVAGRPSGKPLMTVREEGAIGFAIDLMQYDAKHKAAMWYVFRDTIVVKNLDVARRHMGGVRLVTLDGDIIDAGGAMTGGTETTQTKLKFGAPSREDLDKVAKRLRAAVEQQEHLSQRLLELREAIVKIEDAMRGMGVDTAGKAARLTDLEARRKEYEAKLSAQRGLVEKLEKDLATSRRDLEKHEARIRAGEEKLAAMDASREDTGKLLLKSTAKDLAEKLTTYQDELLALNDDVRALASQLDTGAKQAQIVGERIRELTERLAATEAAIEENHRTAEAQTKLARDKGEELSVLLKVEQQQSGEARKLQEERDRTYERKVDLAGKIAKLAEKIDATGDLVIHQQAKIPEFEADLAEAESERAAYAHVELPAEIGETLDELKPRNKEIEQALARIGPINMRALEDHDASLARKKELEDETARLSQQKEELLALVEEINVKKKEGLMKVFEEINRNFSDIFSRLSDGGTAELRLENEARPFEGGLVIRAQPKGKKVYRLDLLSGGEKGLTSMAFIFAIQRYAPSPFYVLDEVDQNLDGINAELIAKMVKENSTKAQFLQISLRKVTLKEADHVYGVTMQETGFTDIVGEVKLEDLVEPEDKPKAATSEVTA